MLSNPKLSFEQKVNLGSFYTPNNIVLTCKKLILNQIKNIRDFTILDTSCGAGNFFIFNENKQIGVDIDETVIELIEKENYKLFNYNSLFQFNRQKINISKNEKLLIIGNPPYNDITSFNKKKIKENSIKIDEELMSRDLGISFLKSYNKLEADYICVLHPLSYLIKKANFNSLKEFKNNYRLIDSCIFSSKLFSELSKTEFPIVIALYKRDCKGMDFEYIKKYNFKTIENKFFSINDFDFITNEIDKYPNHNKITDEKTIGYFFPLRDINALKRNATFLKKNQKNSIKITQEKLKYFSYIN